MPAWPGFNNRKNQRRNSWRSRTWKHFQNPLVQQGPRHEKRHRSRVWKARTCEHSRTPTEWGPRHERGPQQQAMAEHPFSLALLSVSCCAGLVPSESPLAVPSSFFFSLVNRSSRLFGDCGTQLIPDGSVFFYSFLLFRRAIVFPVGLVWSGICWLMVLFFFFYVFFVRIATILVSQST